MLTEPNSVITALSTRAGWFSTNVVPAPRRGQTFLAQNAVSFVRTALCTRAGWVSTNFVSTPWRGHKFVVQTGVFRKEADIIRMELPTRMRLCSDELVLVPWRGQIRCTVSASNRAS